LVCRTFGTHGICVGLGTELGDVDQLNAMNFRAAFT